MLFATRLGYRLWLAVWYYFASTQGCWGSPPRLIDAQRLSVSEKPIIPRHISDTPRLTLLCIYKLCFSRTTGVVPRQITYTPIQAQSGFATPPHSIAEKPPSLLWQSLTSKITQLNFLTSQPHLRTGLVTRLVIIVREGWEVISWGFIVIETIRLECRWA